MDPAYLRGIAQRKRIANMLGLSDEQAAASAELLAHLQGIENQGGPEALRKYIHELKTGG